VVEELRRHGVQLISVSDGFDLEGPAAEIVLAVMAWASKMERVAINERISAARERVEAEGRSWGRPRRLDEAAVARARALRAEGRTLREIAVAMKVPKSTLDLALSNKVGAK
jgi:DNA invertase Pin-like site-specific DNA recombinase